MMNKNIGTLILAIYPERGLAEEDFEILHDEPLGPAFEIIDAAIVFKDERGRVGVAKRSRRKRRRGALAPARGLAVNRQRGLTRQDLHQFSDTLDQSSAAVVAVGRGRGAEKLGSVLHCTDLTVNQLKPDDLAFRSLLSQHSTRGQV